MKTKLNFKAIRANKNFRKLLPFAPLAVVVLGFAVTGLILTIASRASTYTTPKEAELGTIAGAAAAKTDTKASGTGYVNFGAAATTPPPGTNPPPPGTTPPPPAGDGTTAAATFNWGTPAKEDNMDSLSGWGAYNSPNDQYGKRLPSQVSVQNGTIVLSGQSDGKTGAMAMKYSQYQGRWEVREKVTGDSGCWRPVLLTWPDAEDWPVGGEIDYAENGGGGLGTVDIHLHYGAGNSQTSGDAKVDMSQWNNYAMEWTADHVRVYVNGKQVFEDANKSHLPPRSMHQTAQLDGSQGCNKNTQQVIDWVRVYKLN